MRLADAQSARRRLSLGGGSEFAQRQALYTDPANIAMMHPSISEQALGAGKLGVESLKALMAGGAGAAQGQAALNMSQLPPGLADILSKLR
jgi:hypothetical protein